MVRNVWLANIIVFIELKVAQLSKGAKRGATGNGNGIGGGQSQSSALVVMQSAVQSSSSGKESGGSGTDSPNTN